MSLNRGIVKNCTKSWWKLFCTALEDTIRDGVWTIGFRGIKVFQQFRDSISIDNDVFEWMLYDLTFYIW